MPGSGDWALGPHSVFPGVTMGRGQGPGAAQPCGQLERAEATAAGKALLGSLEVASSGEGREQGWLGSPGELASQAWRSGSASGSGS